MCDWRTSRDGVAGEGRQRRWAIARAGRALVAVVALALTGCAPPGDDGPSAADQERVLYQALESMARRSEAQHDYAKAAEQYGRLASENPDNEAYILGLARNQRYAGAPAQAVRTLRRAVAQGRVSETVPIRLERVRALLASGALADARHEIDALGGDIPDAPGVMALTGIIADRDGRHDEAQAAYQKALALDPDDLRSANNLALSLALSGALGEAIALQTRTAAHHDATLQMRQNLALLHALAGNMTEATRITRDLLPKPQAERVVADLRRLSGRGGPAASATLGGGSALP